MYFDQHLIVEDRSVTNGRTIGRAARSMIPCPILLAPRETIHETLL